MSTRINEDFAAGWQSADDRAAPFVLDIQGALQTIAGYRDDGPWAAEYQFVGGGYVGLQRIAEAALARLDEFREVAPRAFGERETKDSVQVDA